MKMDKALNNIIKDFLAERRESDGGWAVVTKRDYELLNSIIARLIEMKWGKDPDGDRPIQWMLIDRTRFEPMHYELVPYGHEIEGQAALEHLNIVTMNANIAHNTLDTTLRMLQLRLQIKSDSIPQRCIHCGKPRDDPKHIKYGPDLNNPVKHGFEAGSNTKR